MGKSPTAPAGREKKNKARAIENRRAATGQARESMGGFMDASLYGF